MPLAGLTETPGAVHVTWLLQATRSVVWEHLTTPAVFPTWLGRATTAELWVGGRVVVDHADGYLCESRILRLEPESHLEMTWQFPDEPESRLAFAVVPADGADGSVLLLSHSGLGDLTASYVPGWLTHLTWFEASLGGNIIPSGQFWGVYETLAHLHSQEDWRGGGSSFSVSRTIRAPRQAVWERVADPAQHHRLDATRMVGSLASARPKAVGDVFTMNMTYRGEDYQSDNHILAFDPGTCIAWATALPGGAPLGWSWRYDLEDVGNGTSVRLTHDWAGTSPANVIRFGVPLATPAVLALSLDHVARLVESPQTQTHGHPDR